MACSTRFPVAVHILAVLAAKEGECVSSDLIAGSVATNRVVVRRILSLLQKANMVSTQAGVHGGAVLAVAPRRLKLLEIYHAVERGSIFRMHRAHPKCAIACGVKKNLAAILNQAEAAMEKELAKKTLADVTESARRADAGQQKK